MKASELRIGNYVYFKGKVDIVPEVRQTNKLLGYCVVERYYKPIPLTEQWLLDFGFKKYDAYYTTKYGRRLKYHKVTPRFPKESKYYREPYFVYNPSRIEINYVHQFQNLHFALTGEELTIKDKII